MATRRANPLRRSHEDDTQLIQQGALARNALGFTRQIAADHRNALVDRAIAEYRAGTLSPIQALAYVAQMAGLEDLRVELETLGTRGMVSEERREKNA